VYISPAKVERQWGSKLKICCVKQLSLFLSENIFKRKIGRRGSDLLKKSGRPAFHAPGGSLIFPGKQVIPVNKTSLRTHITERVSQDIFPKTKQRNSSSQGLL